MTHQPTVYVVVPVHNRKHYTEPFLRCMVEQTWPNLKVIIVDDGSTDGTSEMIREQYPEVVLLHGDGNLWWTAATNVGIREALKTATDDDYVLVMNDDLEVDGDFVETLVRFAQTHPKSLVGAITVDISNPDLIDDGGVMINGWTAKSRVLNKGAQRSEIEDGYFVEPSYLTGRTALIPAPAFHEVGLYDEEHFINCGDTEFPVRAARKGYRLYVLYDAVVKNHVDAVQAINKRSGYSFSDIREYFFGIKSYARLKYRFYFARTAAKDNPLRYLSYLSFDLARITYHFFKNISV